jgi:hypothetical protein
MTIIKVQDGKSAQDFLEVSLRVYQNDPTWIRPLDQDIESTFDPQQNDAFKHG